MRHSQEKVGAKAREPRSEHEAEEASIDLRLFGPMAIRVCGRTIPRLRTRKGLWLLALLSLRAGRDVERSWLAGTLWPECDEAHALRSLRQSLHDLRLALGSESWRLKSDSPRSLRFDISDAFIDTIEFEALIETGDAASVESAVNLYRGALLEGCAEEWVLEERRRFEEAYIVALERLASEPLARNDPVASARWLRRAVSVDPYREDLQDALMVALEAAGDCAAALAIYQELRTLLWREMSAAPADKITETYHRIRESVRQKASARPPARANPGAAVAALASRLPVPLTELIGREEAISELRELLRRSRLVTLTGTGGIGKTRIAIRLATESGKDHEDGVCFVGLAGLADRTRLGESICEALGILSDNRDGEPLDLLTQHFLSRKLLLVLDNCEHIASECATLAESLLELCPSLSILATSRQPFGMRGETVWRVPPLSIPPETEGGGRESASEPTPVAAYSAVQLFTDRAHAAESSFQITRNNSKLVTEICRQLDGIPLAIELAAARVRSLPLEELRTRLRKGIGLLQGSGPGIARHETLEAAFQWSWDLLAEREKRVLATLSVFSGGWTLEAAKAVCSSADTDGDEVVELLSSLVDKSLVAFSAAATEKEDHVGRAQEARYHLLETVRQFASQRLTEQGDSRQVCIRHRDYFLEWAEEVSPKLVSDEQALWFARLEVDHDNLRAALDWSRDKGDLEPEALLCLALGRFWDTYGHLREGRARLESVLSRVTPDIPWKLRARTHGSAGWMAHVQSDDLASARHFEEAIPLFREGGDDRSVAHCLNMQACAYLSSGDLPRARVRFEESLQLWRQLGMKGGMASVLNNIGDAAQQQGDYAAARSYWEESATLSEEAGFHQLRGITMSNLAVADLRDGEIDEAEDKCALALQIFCQRRTIIEIPKVVDLMGIIAAARHNWNRAARLLGAAMGCYSNLSMPKEQSFATERENAASATQSNLGPEAFDSLCEEGIALTLDQSVALALNTVSTDIERPPA